MQQFIPFEDDWDLLERLGPEQLRPYRLGLASGKSATPYCTGPMSPSTVSVSPTCAPMRVAVPAGSSSA